MLSCLLGFPKHKLKLLRLIGAVVTAVCYKQCRVGLPFVYCMFDIGYRKDKRITRRRSYLRNYCQKRLRSPNTLLKIIIAWKVIGFSLSTSPQNDSWRPLTFDSAIIIEVTIERFHFLASRLYNYSFAGANKYTMLPYAVEHVLYVHNFECRSIQSSCCFYHFIENFMRPTFSLHLSILQCIHYTRVHLLPSTSPRRNYYWRLYLDSRYAINFPPNVSWCESNPPPGSMLP